MKCLKKSIDTLLYEMTLKQHYNDVFLLFLNMGQILW